MCRFWYSLELLCFFFSLPAITAYCSHCRTNRTNKQLTQCVLSREYFPCFLKCSHVYALNAPWPDSNDVSQHLHVNTDTNLNALTLFLSVMCSRLMWINWITHIALLYTHLALTLFHTRSRDRCRRLSIRLFIQFNPTSYFLIIFSFAHFLHWFVITKCLFWIGEKKLFLFAPEVNPENYVGILSWENRHRRSNAE